MTVSCAVQRQAIGLCLIAVGLLTGACNTTKATVDTTVNFFSSNHPE